MKIRPLSVRAAKYWAGRIGQAGFIGIVLLIAAAVAYSAWLRPLQAQSRELRVQLETARRHLEQAAAQRGQMAPVTEQQKLGAFYAKFPERDTVPDLLEIVFAQAEAQQVALDEGEYAFSSAKELGLDMLRITLPVKGSYPQIRKFIGATLAAIPTLSLENLSFRREKINDETVNAKVTLVLYLGRGT